mmetsp:Transcript_28567/g.39868  ORF Transcript_28567/g.39868 Transcript_28567/m.39868 type:complete len:135 (+) Transcript_28567:319-723(+)
MGSTISAFLFPSSSMEVKSATTNPVEVGLVKFLIELTYLVKSNSKEFKNIKKQLDSVLSTSRPTQYLSHRISAFEDTTLNHQRPSFTLEVQIRWNNPSRSLDEAQNTFEKWIKDSNFKRHVGASNLRIKCLLYA